MCRIIKLYLMKAIYECPSIQKGMIIDKVRTLAYLKASQETVKPGDVVLDVGACSGILYSQKKVNNTKNTDTFIFSWKLSVNNDSICDLLSII